MAERELPASFIKPSTKRRIPSLIRVIRVIRVIRG